MGLQKEPGWQRRTRTKSCGDFHHSNVKSLSQHRQSAPSIILNKALTKSKPVSRDFVTKVGPDPCTLIQSMLGPSRKLISQGNVLMQMGLQTMFKSL